MYYIIDRSEHGNGGVCGIEILAEFEHLDEALDKIPSNYGVNEKEWGFWPVIAKVKDSNRAIFFWRTDDDSGKFGTWERYTVKERLS